MHEQIELRIAMAALPSTALSVVLALSACPLPSPHALRSSRVMASRTARMSAATSNGPWPSEALQSSTSTDSRMEERDLWGQGPRQEAVGHSDTGEV